MVRTGRHFRQSQALVAPRHNVPGARNIDADLVAAPFNRAAALDLKQFRMQRAPVQLKNELGDLGSYGEQG